MDEQLGKAGEWLSTARKAIAFTGAGVSTESGIPDFRSASGLWARYNPAEYATLGAFIRNPAKVWAMLAELEGLLDARPNAGHLALAELEAEGGLAGIVTQNVDGLHQAAGSRTVVEFHGSGRTLTCLTCGRGFPREAVGRMPRHGDGPLPVPPDCARPPDRERPAAPGGAPACALKPDMVFFDELIPAAAQAGAAHLLRGADLVLVAGTSCEVYPASEIPRQVRAGGGRVIEINLEPALELGGGRGADLVLQGLFSEVMVGVLAQYRHQRRRGEA